MNRKKELKEKAMKTLGMSRAELCRQMNISEPTMLMVFNGEESDYDSVRQRNNHDRISLDVDRYLNRRLIERADSIAKSIKQNAEALRKECKQIETLANDLIRANPELTDGGGE